MTRFQRITWCMLAAAGLLAGGCYDAKELQHFVQRPRMPVSATEYRICPPDVLTIRSANVQEIDKVNQQVRPDGRINVPLLGEVYVAGMTPKEVQNALEDLAARFYSQASVTVEVTNYNSRKFFVFGQVSRRPLPWTGSDTVLDALAIAQPNQLAWPQRILVVRGDDPQTGGYAATRPASPKEATGAYPITGVRSETPDRPRRILTVNMQAMIETGDMSNNVLLRPNDVIYVQPNPFARLGLIIQTVLFPATGARQGVEEYQWWATGMPNTTTTTTTSTR